MKPVSRRAFLKSAALALGASDPGRLPAQGRSGKDRQRDGRGNQEKEKIVEKEKVVQQTVVVEKVKDMVLDPHALPPWRCPAQVYDERIERMQAALPELKVNVGRVPRRLGHLWPQDRCPGRRRRRGRPDLERHRHRLVPVPGMQQGAASIEDMVAADSRFKLDDFYPPCLKGFRMGPGGQGHGRALWPAHATPWRAGRACSSTATSSRKRACSRPPTTGPATTCWTWPSRRPRTAVFGLLPVTGDYSNMRNHTLRLRRRDDLRGRHKVPAGRRQVQAGLPVGTGSASSRHKVSPTASQIAGNQDQMFLAGKLVRGQSGGWGLDHRARRG